MIDLLFELSKSRDVQFTYIRIEQINFLLLRSSKHVISVQKKSTNNLLVAVEQSAKSKF